MTTPTKEQVKEASARLLKLTLDGWILSGERDTVQIILTALQAETERLDWLFDSINTDVEYYSPSISQKIENREQIDSLRNQGKENG